MKDLEAARQIHILLYGLFSEDSIAEALDKMEGNFAFIYQATDQIVASVDKVRSYPLFWGGLDNALFISNSAQMLQQELGLNNKDKDPEAVIELKMAGYVTGTRTLFQDVKQIQPGEFLWVNSNGVIGRRQYYRFYAKRKAELKLGDWIDRLAETTQKVFQDIIDKIDGRQVWIPLSGGLDSRLVLAMFKELGYDNLVTFSYGLSGNWEAKVARQVAQDLGVRWHPMFFRRDWSSMFFFTKIREDYFSFANNLSTVPFLPDFYGLYLLRQEKLIPDEAVIINGQSGDFITGGHIPSFHKTKRDILWAYILECIVSKHYSLWDNLKTQKNIDRVNNRILGSLRWYKGVLTSQSAVDLMEHWEWQERQCKYVINGQRAYDFWDYDWELPLWSDQYLRFWEIVPWELKIGQSLYKEYLKKIDPGGVFNRIWAAPYRSPGYLKLLNIPIRIASILSNKDTEYYSNKYLKYYMEYSPYYSYLPYRSYLKSSKNHRNPISFLSLEMLKEC